MEHFTLSKTTLNYRSPLSVRGIFIHQNDFLVLSNQEKKLFLSTLPAFHQSSLEEIKYMLEHTLMKVSKDNFTKPLEWSKKAFGFIPSDIKLNSLCSSSELLFYLENALFYFSNEAKENYQVKSNALSSLRDGQKQFDSEVVKIKFTANESIEGLREKLLDSLFINPAIKFRIDANRTFELRELLKLQESLLKDIPLMNFDYFEEALKNNNEIIDYKNHSLIEYALDESFHHSPEWCLKYFTDLPIILKPSLLGISKTFYYLENYKDTRFIISSSYEHTSALCALEFLASLRPNEFHGLSHVVSETVLTQS